MGHPTSTAPSAALPPLTNSKGVPTGAVKRVINMMRRMQKDYPQSTVVVVFDAKGKTFRDDIYSEYKAHRPPMPDDSQVQIEPIHNIIKAGPAHVNHRWG